MKELTRPVNLGELYLSEVVTVPQIARHLGLSPSTVRRLIREGCLGGRKLAGRWYVTRRSLLAAIEAGTPRLLKSEGFAE